MNSPELVFENRSKLFVCINLMVEGVGNIVYIFNRRPIEEVDYVFESNFFK